MAIKFTYDGDFGVEIKAAFGDELTVEEARVVAMLGLEKQLQLFNVNVADHFEEFRFKKFFDEESAEAAETARRSAR